MPGILSKLGTQATQIFLKNKTGHFVYENDLLRSLI